MEILLTFWRGREIGEDTNRRANQTAYGQSDMALLHFDSARPTLRFNDRHNSHNSPKKRCDVIVRLANFYFTSLGILAYF